MHMKPNNIYSVSRDPGVTTVMCTNNMHLCHHHLSVCTKKVEVEEKSIHIRITILTRSGSQMPKNGFLCVVDKVMLREQKNVKLNDKSTKCSLEVY